MINKPCAKINLGLNIVSKRSDGYHNLETVFYPIPFHDQLNVTVVDGTLNNGKHYDLNIKGITIEGDDSKNLVVMAYMAIRENFNLPDIHILLDKNIPTGAGMGGGSSDCAYMIKLLNEMFSLGINNKEMNKYAASLGADCPFFIKPEPTYATGIGDILIPICLDLSDYYIAIIKPDIHISTAEAFRNIKPKLPLKPIKEIISQPINTWKEELINDFESGIIKDHPEIGRIKEHLYDMGAVYAAMSGSGSSVFGIFRHPLIKRDNFLKNSFYKMFKL
jgi:4-diphosphocytidyl-2-C-methyl-D-erythritol kinase